jgi:hypothetical protein
MLAMDLQDWIRLKLSSQQMTGTAILSMIPATDCMETDNRDTDCIDNIYGTRLGNGNVAGSQPHVLSMHTGGVRYGQVVWLMYAVKIVISYLSCPDRAWVCI